MVLFMMLLCGGLAALQYRWTGELGRAEMIQLRAGLEDRVQSFCREFDAELSAACQQLLPTAREVEERGSDTAHIERLQEWTALRARPVFRRLAVALPTNGTSQLFELSQQEARFIPIRWPAEWNALRDNLLRKGGPGGAGGPPRPEDRRAPPGEPRPFQERGGPGGPPAGPGFEGPGGTFFDWTGQLNEFPIFRTQGPRGMSEWMIFELDIEYATNSWLPELVGRYLNTTRKAVNDVTIKLAAPPQTELFSTRTGTQNNPEKPVAFSFNPQLGVGRLRDQRKGDGRWIIEVRQRPDALAQIIYASRRRNLGLAVLLNGLMLVAGVALVRYTRRSRQLSQRQMDFVANVSHELRTPLTVICGAGENLARGVAREPEAIKDYSQLIIQHANQLKAMVEQVLAFAGAKKRLAGATHQSVPIGQILGEAVAAVSQDIESADCKVDLEFPPNLPPVRGDALALGRLFQNLISNAAKHGAEGKWIGISARSIEGGEPMVEVQVADRGPGVPKQEQARIFEPFVRGARAQEQAIRGSGLGLSVVREIVQAHGGSVSVRSGPGKGAAFIVRLPADHPA